MAQHDFNIANQGFPAFRADLNNALSAAASLSSGTSAPSTTFAYQLWYDTTNDILKIRNGDDDAWITLFTFDQTNDAADVRIDGVAIASTNTSSGLTLDFDRYQNFFVTLSSGANTLAQPSTEAGNIGQTGFIIFIQPSSGAAGTISLHTDYETAGAAGITVSETNSAYDVVPYIIKADNSILLGAPQLAFA